MAIFFQSYMGRVETCLLMLLISVKLIHSSPSTTVHSKSTGSYGKHFLNVNNRSSSTLQQNEKGSRRKLKILGKNISSSSVSKGIKHIRLKSYSKPKEAHIEKKKTQNRIPGSQVIAKAATAVLNRLTRQEHIKLNGKLGTDSDITEPFLFKIAVSSKEIEESSPLPSPTSSNYDDDWIEMVGLKTPSPSHTQNSIVSVTSTSPTVSRYPTPTTFVIPSATPSPSPSKTAFKRIPSASPTPTPNMSGSEIPIPLTKYCTIPEFFFTVGVFPREFSSRPKIWKGNRWFGIAYKLRLRIMKKSGTNSTGTFILNVRSLWHGAQFRFLGYHIASDFRSKYYLKNRLEKKLWIRKSSASRYAVGTFSLLKVTKDIGFKCCNRPLSVYITYRICIRNWCKQEEIVTRKFYLVCLA